jgi:hypothetical protein
MRKGEKMVTEAVKQVIGVFYPIQDPDEAISTIIFEWLDIRISRMEERIRMLERKYGMTFEEFDTKIKTQGARYEEEDDWIDWGDSIDLVQSLLKIRRDALYQLSKQ